MNYLDVFILIPLLWGAYKGFTKGIVFEIVSVLSLVLGIYIASNFSGFIAEALKDYINQKLLGIIAFTITFIGVLILMFLVAKILTKLFSALSLGIVNKIGGLVFGAFKYLIIVSVFFYLLNLIDSKGILINEEIKKDSLLYHKTSSVATFLIPTIKENLLQE